MNRLPFRHLLVGLALVGVTLVGALPAAAQVSGPYTIPGDTVFPEGVAYHAATGDFYVSSTTDGTIFQGNVNRPALEPFLPGGQDGRTAATGLKVDTQSRLFVSGGATGLMQVYDTRTKQLLGSFNTGFTPTFVNDVAITPNGTAYYTDSMNPVLQRVTTGADGKLAVDPWLNFTGTALTYVQGFNLNGIAASEDGAYLIVVQSNVGKLFRITVADKQVQEINLNGQTVMAGDGLVLTGHDLHVVRNSAGLIATFQLSDDYLAGLLVATTTDPTFAYPTTAALAGERLLVVNSQFNKRGAGLTPVLPFTVSNIGLPATARPISPPGTPPEQPPGMPTTGAPTSALWLGLVAALALLALGTTLRLRLRRTED